MKAKKKGFLETSCHNSKGQSLIEYLIIVALMAVATLSVVRLLQHTVSVKMSHVIQALQGKSKKFQMESVKESDLKKKDLGNFMNGSVSRKK